jgi:hypothetical protein
MRRHDVETERLAGGGGGGIARLVKLENVDSNAKDLTYIKVCK